MSENLDILICEDEAIVAHDLERTLEELGHSVVGIAASGEGGIELAQKLKPDMAIMDIRLAGALSGIETASYLREELDIPSVYTTAYGDQDTISAAGRTRPLAMLAKPVSDCQLLMALEIGLSWRKLKNQRPIQYEKTKKSKEHASIGLAHSMSAMRDFFDRQRRDEIGSVVRPLGHKLSTLNESSKRILLDIAKQTGVESSIHALLGQALQANEDITRFVDRLMCLPSADQLTSKEWDTTSLVEKLLKHNSGRFPESLAVMTNYYPVPTVVAADLELLSEAASEVFANSMKAMNNSGVIDVSTGVEFEELPERFNKTATPGWFVTIEFKDEGSGINTQERNKILDPGFSAWPGQESSGLGLWFVHGALQAHRGWMEVAAAQPCGTRIKFFLPQLIPPVKTQAIVPEMKATKAFEGRTVALIIDDQESVANSLQRYLKAMGHDARAFTDPVKAIDWYRDNQQSVKVILLDLMMPNLDGEQCFHQIRDINQHARVGLMSGYSSELVIRKLIDAGAHRFFEKPFNLEQLEQWVKGGDAKSHPAPL